MRQHQDSRCGELLRDRADLEDGLRLGRDVQFHVSQAIGRRLDRLAVTDDLQSEARDPVLLHLELKVIVHLIGADGLNCEQNRRQ